MVRGNIQRTSHSRIIRKTVPSEADGQLLGSIEIDSEQQADDFYDYSKVVVRKPWGYEYLLYRNALVSVWILYIRQGYQTSLHCHPNKKTSITVLSGEALCLTLEDETARLPSEGLVIGKGVFHRTRSICEEGTFVMEVETPVNKRDLVRARDDYGREKMGYESLDHMSFNLHNYNYISFIDSSVYYNTKKRFGNCSVELVRFSPEALGDKLGLAPWDTITLMKGRVLDDGGKAVFDPGDSFGREDVRSHARITASDEIEAIIIREIDTMARLSDFVVTHLKKRDVKAFFYVSDTTNAHLVDAIGRDSDIRSLSFGTERGAVLAAEAYSKLAGQPAAVVVSSGASALGALTGVANAWADSTPLAVISAQSRSSELGVPDSQQIRQLANKEIDIVNIVRPVTKYASVVSDPNAIREHLDRALSLAMAHRQGPVWLDVPIDLLGTNIDETELLTSGHGTPPAARGSSELEEKVRQTLALLKGSRRPVVLAGYGIRAAGAQSELMGLVESLSVPVLTSRRGADLIPEDFALYFGRPGTYGQRAANFIIQNSDLLISIGARLSLPLIGRNYRAFAREARKVIVDVDQRELGKATVQADIAVDSDAGDFIREIRRCIPGRFNSAYDEWLEHCRRWKSGFPPERDFKETRGIGANPYYLVEILSDVLGENDVVLVDGGASLDYVMQTFRVKKGQRIISSPGLEHQGFSLPGAIGVYLRSPAERIVCLCEDRGLQASFSDLQTIVENRLPVKVFVFNSQGKDRVRQTQAAYFGGRHVGSVTSNIACLLNVSSLGEAYKLPMDTIAQDSEIRHGIEKLLSIKGPALCEVLLPEDHEIIPRLLFTVNENGKWISRPLEDMYPLLDREELKQNMLIDLLDD